MPLTRPVVGADISAADFGQPVYDFVAASTPGAWTNMALSNSWSNVGGLRPPSGYRKVGDMVQVRLAVVGGTFAVPIFVFPVGYRPLATYDYAVRGGGGMVFLNVGADGVMAAYQSAGSDNTFVAQYFEFPTT